MTEIKNDKINNFLKFGYFFDYNPDLEIKLDEIDKKKYESASRSELVKIGGDKFLDSISKEYEPNKRNLVPISGGLDSRAILAGLLRFTDARNIETYTFGVRGSLDFEIGNYIAKKLGTNHMSFDLEKYDYDESSLFDISSRVDRQTMLFHHAPIKAVDQNFKDHFHWSGFMGDPIAGSKYKNEYKNCLKSAKEKFLLDNVFTTSVKLYDAIEQEYFLTKPNINSDNLSCYEQIDFFNRQLKYVMPHVLMKGYDYKLPFVNSVFSQFMLDVDNKYRDNQNLYYDILLQSFPKEFKYRTRTKYGLPLNTSHRVANFKRLSNKFLQVSRINRNINVNYMDFANLIRRDKKFYNLIRCSVNDFNERKFVLPFDVNKVLLEHVNGYNNHTNILLLITSLDIHLKNGLQL